MTSILFSYLPLLLLTLVLEFLVVRMLTRPPERAQAQKVCLALNLFTHPVATILLWQWSLGVLLVEVLVLLCEWLGYMQLLGRTPGRALGLALAANLVTWIAATLIWIAKTA